MLANVAEFFAVDSNYAESRIQKRLDELPTEQDLETDDDDYFRKEKNFEDSDEKTIDNMFDGLL